MANPPPGPERLSPHRMYGDIDVQMPCPDVAIATYGYHFHAIRSRAGTRLQIDMPMARATQIFRLEADGELRIVHEHSAPPRIRSLPRQALSFHEFVVGFSGI